jgi:UDP-glucuronate 4-epimerase
MATFGFTEAILRGKPIDIYNNGQMMRDFTYIDDVVESLVRLRAKPASPEDSWFLRNPDPATSFAPFRVYNVGNHKAVNLLEFVSILEKSLGKIAEKCFLPMQPGDVLDTYADVDELDAAIGFRPSTPVEIGVAHFVAWYQQYYGVVPLIERAMHAN